MNPLRYLDREALGTLRTRLRWRWKALLSQRGIAPEDGDESTAMVVLATAVTLAGVGILTVGLWHLVRFDPTTDHGVVGVIALTLVVLFSGWKLVKGGVLELSYLAYVGWRPPAPTDEVTLIALAEFIAGITLLSVLVGSVGGIAGALVDVAGYGGWFPRMWPWFALVACVGLLVVLVVVFAGERAFGDRFMTTGDPEESVEGVEG